MRTLRIMALLVAFSFVVSGPVLAQESMAQPADSVTENAVPPAYDAGSAMTSGSHAKAAKSHVKKHKAAKASVKKHHAKKKASM